VFRTAHISSSNAHQRRLPNDQQTLPIDLYYWPTPNGWKITIMLEELETFLTQIKYINIGKGEQFEPSFLKPSRPTTACRRSSIPEGDR
jgi:hypothetical protein